MTFCLCIWLFNHPNLDGILHEKEKPYIIKKISPTSQLTIMWFITENTLLFWRSCYRDRKTAQLSKDANKTAKHTTSKHLRCLVCGRSAFAGKPGWRSECGISSRGLTSEAFTTVWRQRNKGREKQPPPPNLWEEGLPWNNKEIGRRRFNHVLRVCYYQFVLLAFTMDEKAASSIAFGVHDLTDPHATDPASFLWEPSPAGVISGHNHSLDTHNIAVTKTTTTRRTGHDNGLVAVGHVSQYKMNTSRHCSGLIKRKIDAWWQP